MGKKIEYWRNPTAHEIKFGYGAIHWIKVPIESVKKRDGTLKKWFIGEDGLRYNRP